MTMPKSWENNLAFRRAARLLWPEDYALAEKCSPTKGRAEARRRIADRYDGWCAINQLASLADAANEAIRYLRGQS